MGQVLHRSATTTVPVRRAIQHSQGSLRALAKRHWINPLTVAKWKRRTSASDMGTRSKDPKSTILSIEEEVIIVAVRRHKLLLRDDYLYALQATIPHLTRSLLHRCLQRDGMRGTSAGQRQALARVFGINFNNVVGRGSEPVDLATIPLASIARVETCATAPRHNTAPMPSGRVINIVLKSSSEGGSKSAQSGLTSVGDGALSCRHGQQGFSARQ